MRGCLVSQRGRRLSLGGLTTLVICTRMGTVEVSHRVRSCKFEQHENG